MIERFLFSIDHQEEDFTPEVKLIAGEGFCKFSSRQKVDIEGTKNGQHTGKKLT